MAATPGAATKMNKVAGYHLFTPVTAEELSTTMKDKVFKKGMPLLCADGKILVADGTTKLGELPVRVDQVLVAAEKTALQASLSTGSYVPAQGGVVILGAGAKIADAQLNCVADGKIVQSYLSDIMADGKIKLDVLPDTVRAGVTYVSNYAALASVTAEQKKGLVFVIDASGDTTVNSGAAMYAWDASAASGQGAWVKIAEVESLDIDTAALTPNYTNVQAAGAVMYDHPVELGGSTLTEIAAIAGATVSAD